MHCSKQELPFCYNQITATTKYFEEWFVQIKKRLHICTVITMNTQLILNR